MKNVGLEIGLKIGELEGENDEDDDVERDEWDLEGENDDLEREEWDLEGRGEMLHDTILLLLVTIFFSSSFAAFLKESKIKKACSSFLLEICLLRHPPLFTNLQLRPSIFRECKIALECNFHYNHMPLCYVA